MKLFHITKIDNIDSILTEGLKVNDNGELFLFKQNEWKYPSYALAGTPTHWVFLGNLIAMNQLFMKEYALFEVDVNENDLEPDNVAEYTAEDQFIYHKNIEPDKIEYCCNIKYDVKKPWKFEQYNNK